jgi:hypothetical protein
MGLHRIFPEINPIKKPAHINMERVLGIKDRRLFYVPKYFSSTGIFCLYSAVMAIVSCFNARVH